MYCALRAIGLICAVAQVTWGADRIGADRISQVERLVSEYDTAAKAYNEVPRPKDIDEQIRLYEAWPGWQYIPRFLDLAQAQPDDEAAYLSCQWIIERMSNVGNVDKTTFEVDQSAWEILAAHHTHRSALPMMCLRAVIHFGSAREQFLRGLLARADLSHENRGFATIALAESLARKCELIESSDYSRLPTDELSRYNMQRKHPDWGKDLIPANASKFKSESIDLLHEVLDHYADVPMSISAPYFRNVKNLGEKARSRLHALEHLSLGAEAPNIVGKDLQGQPMTLRDYRGKVVMLSFWFTAPVWK